MTIKEKGKLSIPTYCVVAITSRKSVRHDEINNFLNTNPAPTVLTDPFPSQQQLVDHMSNQGNSNDVIRKY